MKVTKPFKSYRGDNKFAYACYSLDDKDQIFPLLTRLDGERYRIRYDECVQDEVDALRRHNIRNCEVFLAFISEKALLMPYVLEQIEKAKEYKSNIYIVYLDDTSVEKADKFFDEGSVKSIKMSECEGEQLHGVLCELLADCLEPEKIKERVYTYDELMDEVYPGQEYESKTTFETAVQTDDAKISESASKAANSSKKAKLQKRSRRLSEFFNALTVVGVMIVIALICYFFFGEQLNEFFNPDEVVNFAPVLDMLSIL